MIKSKIDARERALEIATQLAIALGGKTCDLMPVAKELYVYLIGDAELPETQSDTELVKAFLEVMNSELDKKCKPMPDYSEMLKAVQKDNAGVSAEVPCKSENEQRMRNKVNWEQARINAAISAMQGIIANSHDKDYRVQERYLSHNSWRKKYPNEIAETAVSFADALIAELKKTDKTK